MELTRNGTIEYVRKADSPFEIAFLTRLGGVSLPPYNSLNMSRSCGDDKGAVDKNYEKIFAAFGIKEEHLIRLNQAHGDDILIIRNGAPKGEIGSFDAVVTDNAKLCLSIMTADCAPVFLFDKRRKVFAGIHSGWRGTALGIVKKTARAMIADFKCDVGDINAVIGPAIKACCYEVSGDVLEKLLASVATSEGAHKKNAGGKIFVDLQKFISAQLKEVGIKEDAITLANYCASCRNDLFFSYRKENITGRQLNFIRMAY